VGSPRLPGMQYTRRLGFLSLLTWLSSVLPMAASASDAPLELTLLRTVNLPWQQPEVIVTAQAAVESLVVTVSVDGNPGEARTLRDLPAGATRSITWPAAAGSHDCEVLVRGTSAGRAFEARTQARVDVVAPLEVTLAPRDVNLQKGKLRFHTRSDVSFTELALYDLDGNVLHQATKRFDTRASEKGYDLAWPTLHGQVARVALRVFSTNDTWADVEWSPLEIEVPHEPIYFDEAFVTGPSLEKLDGAYAVLQLTLSEQKDLRGLQLYVLGTGVADGDLDEAKARAHAVAAYFRERGLSLPLFIGGAVDTGAPSAQGEVQAILALQAPSAATWTPLSKARAR
jgi:hypothetical protein